MDQGPLVIEETEAGAEFIREFNKYMPVTVAFWVKAADDGGWMLHIASDRIDDATFDLGYGEALRLAQEMRSPYINLFRVKLIRADDPLARAALTLLERYPGRMATRMRGLEFGVFNVDEVYVYPQPAVVQ